MYQKINIFFSFKKIVLLGFLTLCIISKTQADDFFNSRTPFQKNLVYKRKITSGLNIKLSPALFWRTLIFNTEYVLTPHFSLGINLMGKLGGNDSKAKFSNEEKEAYLKPGYSGELAIKYYIKREAPEGLYIQLNGGYNTIFYADGNTRPYTLHNHWRKKDGGIFNTPKPYFAGLGIGYQVILLPDHFIADVMLGVQGNSYENGISPISIYITPSLGYKF